MRIWRPEGATHSDGVKFFVAASLAIGAGEIVARGATGAGIPAALLCAISTLYVFAICARNAREIRDVGAGFVSGAVEGGGVLWRWAIIAALCLAALGALFLVASWLVAIPLWAAVLIVIGVLILLK